MLASPTSRWSAGAILLTALVLVASWFLLIGPRRADASALQEQTVAAQSQASTLQIQIAQLKADFSTLDERRAELAAIKRQLPPQAEIPALVRKLQDYAAASGVSLDSITPGTPAIYGQTGAGASGTAQPGQVVEIPITVVISGDYFEDSLFVKSLQTKLTRAFLITGLATSEKDDTAVTDSSGTPATAAATPVVTPVATPVAAAPTLKTTSLQITGSVFTLLDSSASLADVAEQAQAATSAATGTAAAAAAGTSPS